MSGPQGEIPRSGLVLISLALFAGVSGAALYVRGYLTHSPAMRDLAFLAVMTGTLLAIRASAVRGRARRAKSADGGGTTVPTAGRRSRRVIRTAGIAVGLLGVALFAVGLFSWGTRLFGLVVAMAGVAIARTSFDRAPSVGPESDGEAVPGVVRRFDHVMRITGIALVPLMAFSTVALFLTPVIGRAWPLYTFFVVGLICALVWSYLFARFFVWLAVGGWRQ